MTPFVMLGNYSKKAIKDISGKRTQRALELAKKCGGHIEKIYALLGQYDLLILAHFPDTTHAMKFSVALNKLTDISFITCPALSVEDFDRIVAEE